jgi:hypothetical protein
MSPRGDAVPGELLDPLAEGMIGRHVTKTVPVAGGGSGRPVMPRTRKTAIWPRLIAASGQ